MIEKYSYYINSKILIKVIIIFIILDVILGSIRALKEHQWNSTVGRTGLLKKIAMIVCIIFTVCMDYMLKIDMMFFMPDEIMDFIKIQNIGLTELFGILYILYETTSILKNMLLCGLPVPKGMRAKIESLLKNMTTELEDKKEG